MEIELKKLSSDGKIAYLIKPILTVLQDAGGKLDRTEIKNRISDLDDQIAEFAEAVKTSKSTGNTYKEFNFKFNFAIKDLSFTELVSYTKGNPTITLTKKGLEIDVDSLDVEKYGKIIKSMTEILIKEAQIKELAIKKREKNRNIIESILYNQNKNLEFYISLNFPYTVIVGKTNDKIEDNNILYKAIEDLLPKDKKSIFTITSNYIIIFLNSIKENYIENTIKFLQKNLDLNLKLDFKFGIGRKVEKIEDFTISYLEAKNSLKYISSLNLEEKYIFYSELDLGIIFSDIQNEKIDEFINKIFKTLKEEEIKYFYNIFIAYKKNNGSILDASKSLFMHKNTLQYQLNKLYKLTGYNPRKLEDFSILDLAFMFKKFKS